MKKILIVCLFAIVAVSCTKQTRSLSTATTATTSTTTTPATAKVDTVLFGWTGAPCNRIPCGLAYLLQNGSLYFDQTYFMVPMPPATTLPIMTDSQYQKAKVLTQNVPVYLIQDTSVAIGYTGSLGPCILLWVTYNGKTFMHTINADTTQLPVEIRPYIWQVQQVIRKI